MNARIRHYLIACVCLLGATAPVIAKPVDGLYQGEVQVALNQSEAQRTAAMREALTQVLARLLPGDALQQAAPRSVLAEPQRYVSQYRYLRRQSAGINAPEQRLLQVDFNESALKQALKAEGMAVWGEDRPEVLVWLLAAEQKRWLKAETDAGWYDALGVAAKQKGLPLLFPLMDLSDVQQLSYTGSKLDQQVVQASQRYQTEAVLLGRLRQQPSGGSDVQWTLYQRGEADTWSTSQLPLDQLAYSGVQGAYDRLVLRRSGSRLNPASPAVAVTADAAPSAAAAVSTRPRSPEMTAESSAPLRRAGQSGMLLKVSGIQDINDFAEVTGYLKSLPHVRRALWLKVTPRELWFQVQAKVGLTRLQHTFDIGGIFQPAPSPDTRADLHYQLLR